MTTKIVEEHMGKKAQNIGLNTDQPKIPYDRILVVPGDNARFATRTSPEAVKETASSILANGLLEPIGVKIIENPELTEDEREMLGLEDGAEVDYIGRLVYGFRRHAAIGTLIAEDPDFMADGVPFVAVRGDAQDIVFANLSENLDREDLLPAEMAERFALMVDTMDISPETIAQRLGKLSGQYIRGLVALKKKLCADAWEAFAEGLLTYDVAREIQKAGKEDAQKAALAAALEVVESQKGKKKKKGVKKAAAEAAEKHREENGEGSGEGSGRERSSVLRPGLKDVKAEYEKRAEAAGDNPVGYDKGVLMALEYILGKRKRIPNVVSKDGTKKAKKTPKGAKA